MINDRKMVRSEGVYLYAVENDSRVKVKLELWEN